MVFSWQKPASLSKDCFVEGQDFKKERYYFTYDSRLSTCNGEYSAVAVPRSNQL